MARIRMSLIAIGLVLIGCSPEQTSDNSDKETHVVSADGTVNNEIPTSTELQSPLEYEAKDQGKVSLRDSQTAYEMCVRALNDFYKAVWNGSAIKLEQFIDNENLKQYTQKKIQYQYDLHSDSTETNEVQHMEISDWKVEYTDDEDGGYLYVHLPVNIQKTVGGFGEITEFLVKNVKGKLVIVDWYTGGKDSYDFMVRGENETIDNPNIWNDHDWVEKLENKQNEFSGSIRW